jgi:two-component system cell cycle sensor histidine kinase/response regulator CckA
MRAESSESRTVLVVDDERNVVSFVSEMLLLRGFTVLRAERPREALEAAAEFKGRLDLLLSDVVMPAMNGRELAGRVARLRPETRVLFMSAYSDEIITRHGVVPAGVDLIRKPFRLDDLVRRIEEVMLKSQPWIELPNAMTRMIR